MVSDIFEKKVSRVSTRFRESARVILGFYEVGKRWSVRCANSNVTYVNGIVRHRRQSLPVRSFGENVHLHFAAH